MVDWVSHNPLRPISLTEVAGLWPPSTGSRPRPFCSISLLNITGSGLLSAVESRGFVRDSEGNDEPAYRFRAHGRAIPCCLELRLREGLGNLPCVLDEEIPVSDFTGLYAKGCAALPHVNLKAFRFDCQIDTVEPRYHRQRGALKFDDARPGLKLEASAQGLGCELSAQVSARPINGDSKDRIGDALRSFVGKPRYERVAGSNPFGGLRCGERDAGAPGRYSGVVVLIVVVVVVLVRGHALVGECHLLVFVDHLPRGAVREDGAMAEQ